VDGTSSALGVRARIVIIMSEGIRVEHSFRLGFKACNNEAEYEALLAGLRAVLNLGTQEVEVYSDSRSVQGSFVAKDSQMIDYLWLVKQTMNQFQKVRVVQIARGQDGHADSPATLVSSLTEEVSRLIKVEVVAEPSIDVRVNVAKVAVSKPCWMDLILGFLALD